jgi:hypothetical protein
MAVDTLRCEGKSIFCHKGFVSLHSASQKIGLLFETDLLVHSLTDILQFLELSFKVQNGIAGFQDVDITINEFLINYLFLF